MAARFRTAFRKLVPSWLSDGENGLVLYSIALFQDAWVERLRQSVMARFPSYAPPTALPFIGRDRKIVRGIDEPQPSYAERLQRWALDHRKRGNPFALMNQLAAYCQADVRIRIVDRRGNWYTRERDGTLSYLLNEGNFDWDGAPASPRWARFWVIIYPTTAGEPWAIGSGSFGDPELWENETIGTSATPDQVASVRAIVKDWKGAGRRCEWIIIAYDDASFDPTVAGQPDATGEGGGGPGEWGTWGLPGGSPARLSTARYWKGVDGTTP